MINVVKMKKLRLILMAVIVFAAVSCQDKGGTTPEPPAPEKKYSEVGVWRSGNFFLSLSEDHFLSAYVAADFLDAGTYSMSEDKVISVRNTYFNTTTRYTVRSLDDRTMKVDIAYTDVEGSSRTTSLTLTKSSDEPTFKDHRFVGHSYTWWNATFRNRTIDFNTFCLAKFSCDKDNIKPYPLTLFYVAMGNRMYFQSFEPEGGRIPLIGGWNQEAGTGKITVFEFGYEGNTMSWHDDITSSAL